MACAACRVDFKNFDLSFALGLSKTAIFYIFRVLWVPEILTVLELIFSQTIQLMGLKKKFHCELA